MNYQEYFSELEKTPLRPWLKTLPEMMAEAFDVRRYGDLPKWKRALELMPRLKPSVVDLNASAITIGRKEDADYASRKELETHLKSFHPWRKGPFNIFGLFIDTEWRSDWKWDRVKKHLSPLKDRVVLDIGCGSGYHLLRMAGEGIRLGVGIDITMVFVMQFQVLQKYLQNPAVSVLPMNDSDLPAKFDVFDTVFSMGVLYHQKSPFDHLQRIYDLMSSGGEAVIETLVIDGKAGEVLVPEDRYAQMRNVWFIPTCLTLEAWLKRAGFRNVRLVDVNQTTIEEQRSTPWMTFQSLRDFLDPSNRDFTVEGYPAPKRAVFIVSK